MKKIAAAIFVGLAGPALAQSGAHLGHDMDMAAPAHPQILPGYGGGGFPITTGKPEAQAFFDNGMQLAHAFAHKSAVAAMQEAQRLDPECAMCVWGEAWAGGPTINFGKEGDELKHLGALAAKADRLARQHGTERERALTAALVARYQNGGGGKPGDLAFARAMQQLVERYPTDDEIGTIAADAWLMAPSDGVKADRAHARRSMALLEKILARNPDYTPAIHFYIHATETVGEAGKAERFADRLPALAPNASHLVHMPSHTYYWVGRYQDAASVNARAVQIGIDQAKQLGLQQPDGLWGLPYHVHNITFGIGGALMAGDAATAMQLARPLVSMAATRTDEPFIRQVVASNGYYAFARFAEPAECLAVPEPKLPVLDASWHYMRGEAFARLGRMADVVREAAAIKPVTGTFKREDGSIFAPGLIEIERAVLEGRAAMMTGKPAEALQKFEQAARVQEQGEFLAFADPPPFWYPVRRDVAAAKLALGDRRGARAELRRSLEIRKKDPEALAMLAKLEANTAAR